MITKFNADLTNGILLDIEQGNFSNTEIAELKNQAMSAVSSRSHTESSAAVLVFRACNAALIAADPTHPDNPINQKPSEVVKTGLESMSDEVLENIINDKKLSDSGAPEDRDIRERASLERGRRNLAVKQGEQAAQLEEHNQRREIEKSFEAKRQGRQDAIAALESMPITSIRDMTPEARQAHYENYYQARTEAGHVKTDILNDINKQQAALAYEYGINDSVTFDQ